MFSDDDDDDKSKLRSQKYLEPMKFKECLLGVTTESFIFPSPV
jgi:hypothetical protein